MNVSHIQLKKLQSPNTGELSDLFIRFCEFCCKKCESNSLSYATCSKISGEQIHFCEFCLRNGFHGSKRKNILILSFKAIIAFFYYQNYLNGLHKKMWFHEIKDHITCHKQIGLMNPIFHYDENTALWFIDFNKVGNGNRQVSLEAVLETVDQIISGFRFSETIPLVDKQKFHDKYINAICDFNEKRERPNGKIMLCPTFTDCLPSDVRIPTEKIKNFSLNQMECRKYS